MEDIKKNLGKRLKYLRTKENITQEKLAENLGLQPQTITFLETGRVFISCEVWVKFVNYFNVSPDFFFSQGILDTSEETIHYKTEITRLISNIDNSRLKDIYKIILALK